MKFYPLADRPAGILPGDIRNLRAAPTGEFRAPKAGEWYLSGAVVEAYRAATDLFTPYHIAQVAWVKVETRTLFTRWLQEVA